MGIDNAPKPSVRRHLQQVKHCVEEALAVIENDEAPEHALADLDQAKMLIDVCIKKIGR